LELFVGNLPYVTAFGIFLMVGIFFQLVLVRFSALISHKEELEGRIVVDNLTGVYNRLHLEEVLETGGLEAKPGRSWYLLFVDIDRFKSVNDLYGHGVGDRVLKGVAGLLKTSVRESDLVFRYGGDEFIVAVSLSEGEQLEALVERIQREIAVPVGPGKESLVLRLSIGTAGVGEGSDAMRKAIEESDEAMYRMKNSKKS